MSAVSTFYLASQTNFGNRGCEALVRSTVDLLRSTFGEVKVLVPSLDKRRDFAQWPECAQAGVEFVDAPPMPRLLGKWGTAYRRFGWLKRLPQPRPSIGAQFIADMRRADAILSIGGDVFSLDYNFGGLYFNVGILEAAVRIGKPTVLWGASVGPFSSEPQAERHVVKHLRDLALVTVRESHSVEYLRSVDAADNVLRVVDSAFLLRPQLVDASAWWPPDPGEGVLGLNIGWLIDNLRRRAGHPDGAITEAASFVREVMRRTQFSVLLVPHVAPLSGDSYNNDEYFNQQLLLALGGATSRLAQVPSGLNAAQLKHVISQCRFLIGGRTHATIAGFSSGVPTLSVAYSVKAKGINRDLFGDERYILETPTLSRATLWSGLELLQRDEIAIRQHYESVLPKWRERAHVGADRLPELLGKTRG